MRWLEKFLVGRKQNVLLNGVSLNWEEVKSGIPKGSVLGPLLFLIFINDLPEDLQSTMYLFADDSKIWCIIKDKGDCEILQHDLDRMQEWSEKWLMQYHPDKIKGLCLNNKGSGSNQMHKVGHANVKEVTRKKDLGVIVDSKGMQMLGMI